jgi:hypothetical protein
MKTLGFAIGALLLMTLVGTSIYGQSAHTTLTKDQLQILRDLKKDLEAVKIEKSGAEAEQATLAREGTEIATKSEIWHHAVAKLSSDEIEHNLDAAAQNNAMNAHNAKGCTYRRGHPEDCAAWTAEGDQIETWGKRVNTSIADLTARRGVLQERQDELIHATEDNFTKTKHNSAKLDDLKVQEISIVERVNRVVLDDSFLRDLRLRTIISKQCAEMKDVEDASYCLQSVWDGARRIMPHKRSN